MSSYLLGLKEIDQTKVESSAARARTWESDADATGVHDRVTSLMVDGGD
jgi:hypothetical protein